MSLTIRQATVQDLPKIVPIFDLYREYFKQQKNPIAVEKFLLEKFIHQESVLFLAIENGETIGFSQLYPTFSSLTLQQVWILNDFFIIETKRNKGIGKQLLCAVKEFATMTKSKGIELTVEHTNSKAWRFYEKQGFEIDNEFRTYFYKL